MNDCDFCCDETIQDTLTGADDCCNQLRIMLERYYIPEERINFDRELSREQQKQTRLIARSFTLNASLISVVQANPYRTHLAFVRGAGSIVIKVIDSVGSAVDYSAPSLFGDASLDMDIERDGALVTSAWQASDALGNDLKVFETIIAGK